MKVELTQKHIDTGVRGSTCDCPVALALQEATESRACWAYRTYAVVISMNYLYGPEVKKFIADFDVGLPVQPMTFEMTPVPLTAFNL